MKCLVIINTLSGNSAKIIDTSEVLLFLKEKYSIVDIVKITNSDSHFDIKTACQGYDALTVCGGDGTFNYALNATKDMKIDLMYLPCGTLNDTAKTLKLQKNLSKDSEKKVRKIDIGQINDRLFSYVCATGTFTPIGYIGKSKYKKIFKRFVYYMLAFKEYKTWRINANITTDDGSQYVGEYTLFMTLKSKNCFGLNMNHMYQHNNGKGHLLLIESPQKRGLVSHIQLFLKFFRCFFIGFKKEYNKNGIVFKEFESLKFNLDKPFVFCVDGEKLSKISNGKITMHKQKTNLIIVKK